MKGEGSCWRGWGVQDPEAGKQGPPRTLYGQQGWGPLARTLLLAWLAPTSWHEGRGCGAQEWHLPGGLHTQRGQWGVSSLAAQRGACRSYHRAARLTACGNGRFPGARNPGGSLQRQSGCGFSGWSVPGKHIRLKPVFHCPALGCGGWTGGIPSSTLPGSLNQNPRAAEDSGPTSMCVAGCGPGSPPTLADLISYGGGHTSGI